MKAIQGTASSGDWVHFQTKSFQFLEVWEVTVFSETNEVHFKSTQEVLEKEDG